MQPHNVININKITYNDDKKTVYVEYIDFNDETFFDKVNKSFEEIKRTNNTLRDIINSINAQYITFQLSADEEDEFQKSTVHENVFPHKFNSVIVEILEKLDSDNK